MLWITRPQTLETPREPSSSPEHDASVWSQLIFSWLSPLMSTGSRRHLERNDIWKVHAERTTESILPRLRQKFRLRQEKCSRHALAMALYDTMPSLFWISGISQLITGILQVMAPFTTRYLIEFAQRSWLSSRSEDVSQPSTGLGIGYTIGIVAMLAIQSCSLSQFYYKSSLMGAQSRGALIALVFEKSQRLSSRAKAGTRHDKMANEERCLDQSHSTGWSNGRIMSLIGTDTNRVQQGFELVHHIWTSPFQIGLTIALLVVNLGYSAMAGVAVMIFTLLLLSLMTRYSSRRRVAITTATDVRVGVTQEILQAIRHIKIFAWEDTFFARLTNARKTETKHLQKFHLLRSAIGAFSMAIPIFANMVAIIVFSATNRLDPALVFSSVALINGLRTPLNWLPTSIGCVVDALRSLQRIEDVLLAEEAPAHIAPDPDLLPAARLQNATFVWEDTSGNNIAVSYDEMKHRAFKPVVTTETQVNVIPVFRLVNLSLAFRRSELVCIVGSVGAGKSTLLSALASEMRMTSGSMHFCDRRAFCPQQPWIQNATVRENIIFGKPFDSRYYNEVLHACALLPDLDALPSKDLTEIGERGVTLSGGQKQRICIARAIYSKAGIVLLDDPLSAVDAQVGNQIFARAICGLLQDRCCIMATHQLHVLPQCDRVVYMDEGNVVADGTFNELMNGNETFARMIRAGGANQDKICKEAQQDSITESRANEGISGQRLIVDDEKAVDRVPLSVYMAWARASGTLANIPMLILVQILFRGTNILTILWITWWINDTFGLTQGRYIGIFAALGVAQGLMLFSFSAYACTVGTKASQSMSNRAMAKILKAPLSFFDTTPMGRIMHRFTTDVDQLDNALTDSLRQLMITSSAIFGSVILIIAFFHYFAIAAVVGAVGVWWAVRYYRSSARELKRHHVILDGVVFAKFNEALIGASCIRAYGCIQQFTDSLHKAIDAMNSAGFLSLANQQWLAIRLDNIGNLLALVTGVLVATDSFSVSPAASGLVLSYALSMVGMIQITVKYFIETDNAMTSTERLDQYATKVPSEGLAQDSNPLPEHWPAHGAIEYRNVQMRYRPELPVVIDDFSLSIKAGEKIGIVGRTGAGKSTILSSLLRLTELSSGSITIDGIDIGHTALYDLRSRIAVIPQDPVLFRGTIRANIDPQNQYTDHDLWDALRKVKMVSESEKDVINASAQPSVMLDGEVTEHGSNFSLGQRQLIALARALLRDTKVLLVDEGTSSVDLKTDAHVQAILERLHGKTLISIAHRLRTVLHYDRVCVMDAGRIVELGPPLALWSQGGLFRSMCDGNGIEGREFD